MKRFSYFIILSLTPFLDGCINGSLTSNGSNSSRGISFIQSVQNKVSSATFLTITVPNPPAISDLVVVTVWTFVSTLTSVTDTKGNLYSLATSSTVSPDHVYIYYSSITNTGGPFNITMTTGGAGPIVASVVEFSGISKNGPLDMTISSGNAGSVVTAMTGTTGFTSVNNELLIAAIAATGSNPETLVYDPSWFLDAYETDNISFAGGQNLHKIVSSQGVYNHVWPTISSSTFGAVLATFKSAN